MATTRFNLTVDADLAEILIEIADRECGGNLDIAIDRVVSNELEHRTDPKRLEVKERFWRQVDMSGGPDACWPWRGCPSHGYGAMHAWNRVWRTHQLAWFLTTGEIIRTEDGMVLRHTCDNRSCCNPSHLVPGTQLDNAIDRIERICDQVGEHNYAAKLTEQQVTEIRRRCSNGEMQKDVADDLGVSTASVSLIINGRTWCHSFPGVPKKHVIRTLTKDQVQEVIARYNPQFMSQSRLANEYGVSRSTIRRILNGEYGGE